MDSPALTAPARPSDRSQDKRPVRALGGLLPFIRPYRGRIALAVLFLVLAAVTTLAVPVALKALIDQGLVAADPGERVMALRGHFLALFGVGAALGLFSALRFYMVTWLGERITADLRNAVYRHVVRQSPEFFETTQTGEVLSRLTTDTTLVQTVVGSSLSMGLRNAVMGIGALLALIWTNPYVMTQVLGILVLVVLPSLYFGRRVRKLSRASQDRVADSSAIAAEVLNAIPVVQSYVQEGARRPASTPAPNSAFDTARKRTRVRAALVGFIITATFGALLWGLYQGTQAVLSGDISAGHLGQTVVFVIILVSSVAVLSEVYGDLLRAAGATERLMELLAAQSPVADPPRPRALPAVRGGSALRFEHVGFHYPSRPQTAALADFASTCARRDGGPGRPQRRRQEHGAAAAAALLRRAAAARSASTACRCARPRWPHCAAASASCRRTARSSRPARWKTSATAAPRPATPRSSPPPRPPSRTTSSARCPRATHLPRRTRRAAVGRPAPAHQHRARDAEEPAAAAAGRGHQRARRRERTHGAGRAGSGHEGPHHARHRPPPGHRAARRPHRGAGRPGASSTRARHAELVARGGLYARLAAMQFEQA
jgi:ATP-binding cassette subfamily B protein